MRALWQGGLLGVAIGLPIASLSASFFLDLFGGSNLVDGPPTIFLNLSLMMLHVPGIATAFALGSLIGLCRGMAKEARSVGRAVFSGAMTGGILVTGIAFLSHHVFHLLPLPWDHGYELAEREFCRVEWLIAASLTSGAVAGAVIGAWTWRSATQDRLKDTLPDYAFDKRT
jgi:hypothetical protein